MLRNRWSLVALIVCALTMGLCAPGTAVSATTERATVNRASPGEPSSAITSSRTSKKRGKLRVRIRAPQEVTAAILVRGPRHYRKMLTSSSTLRRLKPGTYRLSLTKAAKEQLRDYRDQVRVKRGATTVVRVRLRLKAAPEPVVEPVIEPVSGLTVLDTSTMSIRFGWTIPSSAIRVVVRKNWGSTAPQSATEGMDVPVSSAKATQASDAELAAGADYSYSVFAISPSGVASPPASLHVVAGLSLRWSAADRIRMGWTPLADSPTLPDWGYRSDGSGQWSTAPVITRNGDLEVRGLMPSTTYSLRLQGRTAAGNVMVSDTITARTLDPASTVFAAGDLSGLGRACVDSQPEVASLLPDGATFLALGDIAQFKGTMSEYSDCYGRYYGRLLATTLPVPGNHDYPSGSPANYFSYFGTGFGAPGASWYARQIGNWTFLMLDSNCDRAVVGRCDQDSAQYKWVQRQLQVTQPRCLALAWHHPRWATGEWVAGEKEWMSDIYSLASEYGADLLLTGHLHRYERHSRRTGDGALSPVGIRQFVVGTGGARPYLKQDIAQSSLEFTAQKFGVLQLNLSPDGYSWDFLSSDGTHVDAGADTC